MGEVVFRNLGGGGGAGGGGQETGVKGEGGQKVLSEVERRGSRLGHADCFLYSRVVKIFFKSTHFLLPPYFTHL